MYLNSLACAVPPHAYSQTECWDIVTRSAAFAPLKTRSKSLLEKVLTGDSGIRQRHFAINDMESLFDWDAGQLNRAFEREAPLLAETALRQALHSAGLSAQALDALFICTCTGYLCPGVSSYVAERLELPSHAYLQDVVGLGCGAAIPTLRAADNFLAAHPGARIGVVAVEICSTAFYLSDDPGVLISLCLFGDGAAASIWSHSAPSANAWRATAFDTLHLPQHRELLRFENSGGKLCNKLHKSVPHVAGAAVHQLFRRRSPQTAQQVILAHAGGRDVLRVVEQHLDGLPLHETRRVLSEFGNMSSPSVLFALREYLDKQTNHDSQALWLTSFGAGFSAHSMSLVQGATP